MSDVFFRDLGLPRPDLDLGVGSGSHAGQTAALLVALEGAFAELEPALVVAYGDVNSTLAAALVAAKTGRPIAHVEAGLRSYDRSMPEEVNRVVTDALADLLFTTSPEALPQLVREGVAEARIHFVGNPMIDTLLSHLDRLDPAAARREVGLEPDEPYAVATLHRPANVDDPRAAERLVAGLRAVAERLPVVIPLHPRGRATLEAAGLRPDDRLRVVEPMGYLAFLSLVRGARLVVTDSGGIQEETTILGIPCLTVRPNTERPITISQGTNRLVEPGELGDRTAEIMAGETRAPDLRRRCGTAGPASGSGRSWPPGSTPGERGPTALGRVPELLVGPLRLAHPADGPLVRGGRLPGRGLRPARSRVSGGRGPRRSARPASAGRPLPPRPVASGGGPGADRRLHADAGRAAAPDDAPAGLRRSVARSRGCPRPALPADGCSRTPCGTRPSAIRSGRSSRRSWARSDVS